MVRDALERIHDMEQVCFEKPWSLTAIHSTLGSPNGICILEDYGYVLGGITKFYGGGECDLYRIAILPEYRSRGFAYSLMQQFLKECNGADVFLEVASKNVRAIKLYQKCGFIKIGLRKNYYKEDGEPDDAITMKREQRENNQ